MTAAPPSSPVDDPIGIERREAMRARLLGETPRLYSPTAHLVGPSLFGLSLVGACLARLSDVRPVEWLTIPVVWITANAFEWWVHRDILHKRFPLLGELYQRHTPEHHLVYITGDMAMRERREYRLVLIPAYGLVLIALLNVPVTLAVANAFGANVGALYLATAMMYAMSYEWLHLTYHLPDAHPLSRIGLVRWLRRHHEVHHHPRLMQRWNFNVTLPLWDALRGTVAGPREEEEAGARV